MTGRRRLWWAMPRSLGRLLALLVVVIILLKVIPSWLWTMVVAVGVVYGVYYFTVGRGRR